MNQFETQIEMLKAKRAKAKIQVQTLGNFQVWREGTPVPSQAWGRDKTVQLFQFFCHGAKAKSVAQRTNHGQTLERRQRQRRPDF